MQQVGSAVCSGWEAEPVLIWFETFLQTYFFVEESVVSVLEGMLQ